jgi:ubiquinone/menaquinone biosynthesis C-methylase UbiE
MVEKIAERLVWAVEMLAVDPGDSLLEVGCGHGMAVSLVCEQLAGGKITAIDRSKAMIDLARKRNQTHISVGKAEFQTGDLAKADFGDARFNKVFAFNVNLFWKQPASELEIIRQVSTPEGALYLFYQPPIANKTQKIADELTQILQEHRYSIKGTLFKELKPAPVVCIIAEAS